MTFARNCAGTMSSISVRVSSIRCSAPPQQGHSLLSTSITTSSRGKCAGSAPRLRRGRTSRRRRRANVEDQDVLGSVNPADFLNKEFAVEGTLECIYQNNSDF